jgi:hypothetical protein
LTVTGDVVATAEFSGGSCVGRRISESVGFLAKFQYVADAGVYELAISGGQSIYPVDPKSEPFNRVRFSIAIGDDYLNWGANMGGEPQATGNVSLIDGDTSAGTFDLQLPFVGDDLGTVPTSTHEPVHIRGDWHCPGPAQ